MKTSRSTCRLLALLLLAIATGCGHDDDAWRVRLEDPDPSVRRAAVHVVASTVDPSTAVPVLTSALDDPDDKVKVAAALGLLKIDPGAPSCRPVIKRALQNGQGPVFVAVGAGGEDSSWAIPALINLLNDRKATVRALAAKTLGEIGAANDKVDAALRRGLRDENTIVRNACQQALDRLQDISQARSPEP